MINLIVESCKEDSNISAMRVLNYVALLSVLSTFILANIVNMVIAVISQRPMTFIDIPIVAGGIVTACITMKAVQSYAEKSTDKKAGQ